LCPKILPMPIPATSSSRLFSTLSLFLLLILINSIAALEYVHAANIQGNDLDNVLYGTMSSDQIFGLDGNDNLFGSGASDTIEGGGDDDYIQGDLADDLLSGNAGNDSIQGGAGRDLINGDDGNDLLVASFANSSMSIRDLAADIISCGSGNDTAFINTFDNDTASSDCEVIIESH
jgi:Ca2+-binding RTX toxin-like protein